VGSRQDRALIVSIGAALAGGARRPQRLRGGAEAGMERQDSRLGTTERTDGSSRQPRNRWSAGIGGGTGGSGKRRLERSGGERKQRPAKRRLGGNSSSMVLQAAAARAGCAGSCNIAPNLHCDRTPGAARGPCPACSGGNGVDRRLTEGECLMARLRDHASPSQAADQNASIGDSDCPSGQRCHSEEVLQRSV
jgi:hypothetical protein